VLDLHSPIGTYDPRILSVNNNDITDDIDDHRCEVCDSEIHCDGTSNMTVTHGWHAIVHINKINGQRRLVATLPPAAYGCDAKGC
jgi:hypothetical protein